MQPSRVRLTVRSKALASAGPAHRGLLTALSLRRVRLGHGGGSWWGAQSGSSLVTLRVLSIGAHIGRCSVGAAGVQTPRGTLGALGSFAADSAVLRRSVFELQR